MSCLLMETIIKLPLYLVKVCYKNDSQTWESIFIKRIFMEHAVAYYAASRKVAGSIPNEVIGFLSWPNPSSHTIALGLTQPLT
jgi:hypothetical protein